LLLSDILIYSFVMQDDNLQTSNTEVENKVAKTKTTVKTTSKSKAGPKSKVESKAIKSKDKIEKSKDKIVEISPLEAIMNRQFVGEVITQVKVPVSTKDESQTFDKLSDNDIDVLDSVENTNNKFDRLSINKIQEDEQDEVIQIVYENKLIQKQDLSRSNLNNVEKSHSQKNEKRYGQDNDQDDFEGNLQIKNLFSKNNNYSSPSLRNQGNVSMRESGQDTLDFLHEKIIENKMYLVLFCIAILGMSFYYFQFYNKEEALNPIQKVAQIAITPENESPTVYKISAGAEILKNPLFAKAVVGDTVMVYNTAKIIYIYREESNKIVNIIQMNETPTVK
jgi:hypothetical protein